MGKHPHVGRDVVSHVLTSHLGENIGSFPTQMADGKNFNVNNEGHLTHQNGSENEDVTAACETTEEKGLLQQREHISVKRHQPHTAP